MQYINTGTFHVYIAPNKLLTYLQLVFVFSNYAPRGMCNIRGNFTTIIILFSKQHNGTSGNLLYISGYLSAAGRCYTFIYRISGFKCDVKILRFFK